MPLELWFSFAFATLLIDISPGPAVTLVVSSTASKGVKAGISSALGLWLGEMIWFILAVAAMLFSYKLSAMFMSVIAIVGAIYLIYIGWGSFLKLPDIFGFLAVKSNFVRKRKSSPFIVGTATQLANPKSYLYWLAFLPQFQPEAGPTLLHNLALVAVVFPITMSVLLSYIFTTHGIKHRFMKGDRAKHLDWLSGGVLILIGLWMLARYLR